MTTNDTFSVNLDDLTIDEIDAIEQATGNPLTNLFKDGEPQAKFYRAIAAVTKHREDPEQYPIETADELAATLRKVGKLRFSVTTDKAEGNPTTAAG